VATGDISDIGTAAEYAVVKSTIGTLPFNFAPGNHDVRWNPLGKEGYTLGVGQPLYRSWDAGGIHFVTLDSTVLLQHWGHFDQKELEWLGADLAKLPKDTPVVIGFHHWIGQLPAMVDNEDELLRVVAPYNVRLLLVGHGHKDLYWSTNGIPTLEQQGLYQGGYSIIDVNGATMKIRRHGTEPVADVPLAPVRVPKWDARIDRGVVVDRGELPSDVKLAYRVDQGPYAPIDTPLPEVREGGLHSVVVQATLPDGRAYQRPVPMEVGASRSAWTAQLDGAVQSHLVRRGDALYVTTVSGSLYALDAATGRERWRFRAKDSFLATPHVEGDRVYVGSVDHSLYAVDAATGKAAWRFRTGASILGSASVAAGVVAVASTDRKIYGLDAKTGAPKWTAETEGMYQSKAATDGARFIFGGWDNTLRALDAASGKPLWSVKLGKDKNGAISMRYSPAISSPLIVNGKVYVSSNDGVLHALAIADGRILWEVEQKGIGYNSPLYVDGMIVSGSLDNGTTIGVDAESGERRWAGTTGYETYDSSFVASRGQLFVGSVVGVLSAVDPKTGKVAWQYRLGPGHMLSTPAADESRIYASSMSGKVVALEIISLEGRKDGRREF
jgi:outer membrane protein assembly factor BamB